MLSVDFKLNQVVPSVYKDLSMAAERLWSREVVLTAGINHLVVAPSGRGKSTLIHYLYGIRKDYSGTILLGETALHSMSVDQWAHLRKNTLSIVFQDLRLFNQLTAYENILLKFQLHTDLSLDSIQYWINLFELSHCIQRPLHTLSYGQQQRIAIIRAMVQPYKWLLLDEPFSHIDSAMTKIIANAIMERNQSLGAGMIITSLDPSNIIYFDQTWVA